MTPEQIKRYRERANRVKRELLKEKQQYGYINDGSGKRYLAPVYYVYPSTNHANTPYRPPFATATTSTNGSNRIRITPATTVNGSPMIGNQLNNNTPHP